jgi:hypothetical protein
MAITDTRLRLFTFPQQWDGTQTELRILTAPFGNPMQPLNAGLPAFANARLVLAAHLIPGAEKLPQPADATEHFVLQAQTPTNIAQLYQTVATEFQVDPAAPPPYVAPVKTSFRKMLMPSYLQASGFTQPRTEYAVTGNQYICALADGPRPVKRPPKPPAPPKWDTVLAMALRQPVLAEKLGLIYRASVKPADAAFFEKGGWLYVTLHDTSDYFAASAAVDFLKVYAARIPALQAGTERPLFAPVLFPVSVTPPAGSFDEILHEAEIYADGFARLPHTFQADRADYLNLSQQNERRLRPFDETGLRLGWDDEQIVIWLNRQLTEDPRNGSLTARDTPLGVRGYRVDVRDVDNDGSWHSLVRMQGPVKVGNMALGSFNGEMTIELAPSQLQGKRDGEYWLPPYFACWTGASLVAPDPTAFKAANTTPPARVLNPAGERSVPLRYGHRYEFRVRLADLTGGGPESAIEETPSACLTACRFRRFIPPGTVTVREFEDNDDGTLSTTINRPKLGYPALLYTGLANPENRLLADAVDAFAQGRTAGFADPDVARLRIDVTVAALEHDPGNEPGPQPRIHLYTTFRDFDADPEQALPLTLAFEDRTDLADFEAPGSNGPLILPTARSIELTFTPIAKRDPGMTAAVADPLTEQHIDPEALDRHDPKLTYFANHAARRGSRYSTTVRRESTDESALLQPPQDISFQGLFLQPTPAHDAHLHAKNAAAGTREQAPETAIQRLARRLRLEHHDLTLSVAPGRRAVFGASATVRHVLSPEHSTISFADETAMTSQWLMVVPLRVARDWTWDALTDEGLQVFRSINGETEQLVGTLSPRKTLSATAIRRGTPIDRSGTDLFFFDAIDPKPLPGQFPRELDVQYAVKPQFRAAPQAPTPQWSQSIHLPIASRPTQVPQILSAGIALSPYERNETYSKTDARRRMLWIELAEPVADPQDACFARVTMHSADPMLTREQPASPPSPLEPPLNIDDELIRSIVPSQPEDSSGLGAMQRLIPAEDPAGTGAVRHFLLPLPLAVYESSPELFGFFAYELRVGHATGWSTAQARFGLPQRVTGIQHPAPTLVCSVARNEEHIRVSAPFALPVADGRILRATPPTTELWALLYAQVRLADASDWRNILIGRTRVGLSDHDLRGTSGPEPQGHGYWDQYTIAAWLEALQLPLNSPLSTLAVELLPEPGSPFADPLGKDLGQVRVLRTSPLTPVPPICLDAGG